MAFYPRTDSNNDALRTLNDSERKLYYTLRHTVEEVAKVPVLDENLKCMHRTDHKRPTWKVIRSYKIKGPKKEDVLTMFCPCGMTQHYAYIANYDTKGKLKVVRTKLELEEK